ncbi:DJ-1/PfpI family protein [candidate division KSB1 bacterium]
MSKNTFIKTILILSVLASASFAYAQNSKKTGDDNITVLMLLGEWFGDTYFTLNDRLEELDVKVVKTGVDNTFKGCYVKDRDDELTNDILIPDIKDLSEYDCLLIPSGPQFRKFRGNKVVMQFIRDAYEAGLVIASLCTGNFIVNESGIIDLEDPRDIEQGKIIEVKERVLLGSRGGGPPPGNGFEGAPVNELCDAILAKIRNKQK